MITAKKEFLRRVNEVVHYLWDPIGVREVPEARNEYDSYSGIIFRKLVERTEKEKIKEYMISIQSETMGMEVGPAEENQIDRTIETLVQWREFFADKGEPVAGGDVPR